MESFHDGQTREHLAILDVACVQAPSSISTACMDDCSVRWASISAMRPVPVPTSRMASALVTSAQAPKQDAVGADLHGTFILIEGKLLKAKCLRTTH